MDCRKLTLGDVLEEGKHLAGLRRPRLSLDEALERLNRVLEPISIGWNGEPATYRRKLEPGEHPYKAPGS